MLTIRYERSFKKDYRRAIKRGLNPRRIEFVITMLANEEILPPKFHDHALSGNYAHYRECHIAPDWLLIYKIDHNELILFVARTGSHSDLF